MATSDKTLEVASLLYDSNTKAFIEESIKRVKAEIGDTKEPLNFHPRVKLKAWDNECNFSMGLADSDSKEIPTIEEQDNFIKWKTSKVEAHFYPKPADEMAEDGKYEFEVIILDKTAYQYDEKLGGYVIPLTLNVPKNLKFYYQPALTAEEIEGGCERPDNVVDSWAVYHDSKSNNEYKTGKMLHIYRLKAIDANGLESWCSLILDVDAEGNLISQDAKILIPKDYYEEMILPCGVDPTFGYTSVGSSTGYNYRTNCPYACKFTSPNEAGTISKISWYGYKYGSNVLLSTAIYADNAGIISNKLTEDLGRIEFTSTSQWWDSSISYNFLADTDYWLAWWAANPASSNQCGFFYYDSSTSAKVARDDVVKYSDFSLWPSVFSDSSYSDTIVSIYATYTASGGGTTEVSKAVQGKYDVYELISKILQGKYSIYDNIGKAIQSKYAVYALTQRELAGKYDIYEIVNKPLQSKYSVYNNASSGVDAVYSIYSLIAKELTGKYDLYRLAGKEITGQFSIYGLIQAELQAQYGIYNSVQQTIQGEYSIYNLASRVIQGIYNIESTLNTVSKILTCKYSIYGNINKQMQGKYHVYNNVNAGLQAVYSVFTNVHNELQSIHDIYTLASSDLQGKYDLYALIGSELHGIYSILNNVVAELQGLYTIYSTASNGLQGQYDIYGLISREIQAIYSILSDLEPDIILAGSFDTAVSLLGDFVTDVTLAGEFNPNIEMGVIGDVTKEKQDFEMYAGETKVISFPITGGEDLSMVKWALLSALRLTVIEEKDITGEDVMFGDDVVTVTLKPEDTVNLSGNYKQELVGISSSGKVAWMTTGKVTIKPTGIKN